MRNDAPLNPPPHNPMPNTGDKTTGPPSVRPMVTEKGAIDTSGMPPVDSTGLPSSRVIGHEEYEVGLRGIFKAMAWFIIVLVVTFVVVYVTLFGFKNVETASELPKIAPSLVSQQGLPPEPRLQPSRGHESTEDQDTTALMNRYDHELKNYGWVDQKSQTVRIPVEKAMEMVLKDPKALPARAGGERPAR
jgi:hypothetical protein